MSVEKIIERISLEAGDRAEALLRSAKKEVDAFLADAEKHAEAEKNTGIAAGRRDVDADVARMLAQARMEGRRTIRTEREMLIERCFEQASHEIEVIHKSDDYPDILAYLIREGIEIIGVGDVVLGVDSRDIPVVKDILAGDAGIKATVRVSDEPVRTGGGVLVKAASGARSVNNTFEARLDRMRRDLVFDVAAILAGEGAGGCR